MLLWDSEYISDSWNELVNSSKQNFKNYSSKNIKHNITAAPTYSGYYDNFDNDKIISYNPNNTIKNTFGVSDAEWNSSKSYSKNWMLFEQPRDLDEWECLDLRSLYQRPAIRMKAILDAISNPVNNGGFNVEWPSEMKATDGKLPSSIFGNYYNLTWIINDRFTFDDYNADTEYDITINHGQIKNIGEDDLFFGGYSSFDTTQFSNPNIQIALNINIPYPTNISHINDILSLKHSRWIDGYWYVEEGEGYINEWVYDTKLYTTSIIEYDFYYGGKSHRYIICDEKPTDVEFWRKMYLPSLPDGYFNGCIFLPTRFKKNTTVGRFINETLLKINLPDIPRTENFTIKLKQKVFNVETKVKYGRLYVPYGEVNNYLSLGYNYSYSYDDNVGEYTKDVRWDDDGNVEYLMYGYKPISSEIKNGYLSTTTIGSDRKNTVEYLETDKIFACDCYTLLDNNIESNYTSTLFDTIQSNIQNIHIDKKVLFQGTKSPLDYLLNFTKLLNLKFIYDKRDNKIKIVDSTKFYTGNIVNIENIIDRSVDINIKPNFWGNKVFKYQLPANDTYLKYISEKKSGKEFLSYSYDTNNLVLNGTSNVCEDFILNSVSLFSQQSVYYDNYVSTPVLKGNKSKLLLFKNSDFSTTEKEVWFNKNKTMKDPIPKLCLFDNDNNSIRDNICLMFLNAGVVFENTGEGVIVTDNLPIMFELNGNPCHIDKYSDTSRNGIGYQSIYDTTTKTIYRNVRYLPYFTPYMLATKQSPSGKWNLSDGLVRLQHNKIYTQPHAICSTLINKPQYKNEDVIYIDNCKFLFDFSWRNYLVDWFDKENREVTCFVKLNQNKSFVDYMRDFYYFDGSVWLLNKIIDFDILSNRPIKCEFIKVRDVNNYLTRYNPELSSE